MIQDIPAQASRATEFQAVGCGCSIAHHGEILQGVFAGADGRLHRGLVTLPCEVLRSVAVFDARAGGDLAVEPAWRVKALEAARLTLAYLGWPQASGVLTVRANIPVCWGLGSSTSDVLATIRAVAHSHRRSLTAESEAALAVRAEAASDSVMFEDRTVLFGQREGLILEDLGSALPALDVLGLSLDPTGRGVDTLRLPPAEYSHAEIDQFETLLKQLRHGVAMADAQTVGLVASASARINQRHLAKPHFDLLERLVEAVGAVGLQVAHSGSVAGFLFDSHIDEKEERMAAARQRLGELGFLSVLHFRTRWESSAIGMAQAIGGKI
jgi:uncharacterized protein involved in propanediol utilization